MHSHAPTGTVAGDPGFMCSTGKPLKPRGNSHIHEEMIYKISAYKTADTLEISVFYLLFP